MTNVYRRDWQRNVLKHIIPHLVPTRARYRTYQDRFLGRLFLLHLGYLRPDETLLHLQRQGAPLIIRALRTPISIASLSLSHFCRLPVMNVSAQTLYPSSVQVVLNRAFVQMSSERYKAQCKIHLTFSWPSTRLFEPILGWRSSTTELGAQPR